MAKKQRTGHGGDRKHGRNKVKCERYRQRGRRRANKLRNFIKYNLSSSLTEVERKVRIAEFLKQYMV